MSRPTPKRAAAALVSGLADIGVSHAVIAPTFYLENLLMPYVIDTVRERGVLPYPIRVDFPASWASHLDVADAVVALFDRPDITGLVSVGQFPAITGPDLAEASASPPPAPPVRLTDIGL
ncbi:hypothetical protein [Streptomyces coeruleorubidus]